MAGAVALAVLFGLWLAWDLLSIKRDLEAGRDRLDGLTLEAAATIGLTDLGRRASGHLDAAADRAHDSVPLRVLGLVPGVDDQVRGIRAMAGATAELGRVGAAAAARLDEALSAAGEPAGRVALLDLALAELDRLEATLDGVDLGGDDGLLPPLRGAHEELAAALGRARAKLGEGRDLIEPVRDLLQGPTRLLLLAGNNAEMAGGAGLSLSAGVLTIEGGDLVLGDVIQAGDLRLPDSVSVPDSLRAIYRPTGVGIDLRSTTRSPDLTATGPVAVQIMARHGVAVDGIVVVDALALRDLLAVTGAVVVGDTAIDEENVLREVLHDNYLAFEGSERDERSSYQGDIAKAVFEALTDRDVTPVALVEALLATSEGRHLLMWSADPVVQGIWEDLGVAGSLDPHGIMVSFQNYGANKMDWYLRPEASIDVGLLPDGDYRARMTMRLPVPAMSELTDASPYILGPGPETHGVFLTVHLPRDAYDITTPDDGGFRTKGVEGPMQVRSFLVDVPLGSTLERTIDFSLPRDVPLVRLLPSARIEPLPVTVDGTTRVDDAEPTVIGWRVAFPPGAQDEPVSPWVRGPVVLGMLASVGATGVLGRWLASGRPGTLPAVAPSLGGAALVLFAVAAAIAMVLAWSGPQQ